jgi:hypothetical protein
MTAYLTCRGCAHAKTKCEHRDAMRDRLKGLSVTSVKWKCGARAPLFVPGDPVWAETWDGEAADGEGQWYMDDFPAVVIKMIGPNALVYIKPDVESRDLKYIFQPGNKLSNGFCKITLSRLKPRDAPRDPTCERCKNPASLGHQENYSCTRKMIDGLVRKSDGVDA